MATYDISATIMGTSSASASVIDGVYQTPAVPGVVLNSLQILNNINPAWWLYAFNQPNNLYWPPVTIYFTNVAGVPLSYTFNNYGTPQDVVGASGYTGQISYENFYQYIMYNIIPVCVQYLKQWQVSGDISNKAPGT